MKYKAIQILIIAFIIILTSIALIGCANDKTKANTTEAPTIYPPERPDYIKDYTLKTHNGVTYIVFDDPSVYSPNSGVASFNFSSVEELRECILSGRLDRRQKSIIVNAFPKDEYGFRLGFDIDNLYVPTFPNEYEIYCVSMVEGYITYCLLFDNGNEVYVSCYPKDTYDEVYSRTYEEYIKRPDIATIKYVEQSDGNKKTIIYTRYYSDSPWSVYIYSPGEDVRYEVRLSELTEIPDESWLMQIGLERYEASDAEKE